MASVTNLPDESASTRKSHSLLRAKPREGRLTRGDRIRASLLAGLIGWPIRLLAGTSRIRIVGESAIPGARALGPGPVICVLWHGDMVPMLRYGAGTGTGVIVSRSPDGEILARVLRSAGMTPVRGSGSRGATRAMIDLARHIEKNKDIAIALDGPRGPRGVVKPGALWLSKATSCAIVPMGIAFGRAKRFGSWDRLALPMPFSRVVMVIGDNVQIGPDAGDDVIQRARVDLEKSMTRLQADAQKCLEPTIFRTLEKPKGVAWTWDRYRQRIGHSA